MEHPFYLIQVHTDTSRYPTGGNLRETISLSQCLNPSLVSRAASRDPSLEADPGAHACPFASPDRSITRYWWIVRVIDLSPRVTRLPWRPLLARAPRPADHRQRLRDVIKPARVTSRSTEGATYTAASRPDADGTSSVTRTRSPGSSHSSPHVNNYFMRTNLDIQTTVTAVSTCGRPRDAETTKLTPYP